MKGRKWAAHAAIAAVLAFAALSCSNTNNAAEEEAKRLEEERKKEEERINKEREARNAFYIETLCGEYEYRYTLHGKEWSQRGEGYTVTATRWFGWETTSNYIKKQPEYWTVIWSVAEAEKEYGEKISEVLSSADTNDAYIAAYKRVGDKDNWRKAGIVIYYDTFYLYEVGADVKTYGYGGSAQNTYFVKIQGDGANGSGGGDGSGSAEGATWSLGGGTLTLSADGTWTHKNSMSRIVFENTKWTKSGSEVTLTCETNTSVAMKYSEVFTVSGSSAAWKSGVTNVNGQDSEMLSSTIMSTVFGTVSGEISISD